ncbi:nuclear transport factor 2 family protein [Pseudidiomarina sp. YC-516-91]|uniref:nuclear transport factor 2 family protein n=1 Tax=Pseudidiomarina salilacus TaxID=3384452 RepID=UPI0039855F2F
MRKLFLLCVCLGLSLSCAVAASTSESGSAERVAHVERFVAAFNAQDSAAMGVLVTDDVQWLSVSDSAEISVEVAGRSELVAAMDGYFAACASCRSELLDAQAYGSRVSVIEQASWRVNDEERSQSSIAVYEFAGDLIARVYYFPAE